MSIIQRHFLAALMLLLPHSAWALSCNATTGNLNFGNVNVLSGASPLATTSSPVTVNCSRGLFEGGGNATVCLYIGAGSGGVVGGNRRLLSGANVLNYNLFKDAAFTQIWGSTDVFVPQGPQRFVFNVPGGLLGGSASLNSTIYASLNGGQAMASVGNYNSTFGSPLVRFANGNVACPGAGGVVAPAFSVVATVAPNCSISAQDLNFGVASSLSGTLSQSTSMNVACTNGAAWSVGLNNGNNFSGSRRMRLGATNSYITYGLFRNPGAGQPWNMGAGSEVTGTGNGGNQTLTVYGRVPAQAVPATGFFVDTVIATITF